MPKEYIERELAVDTAYSVQFDNENDRSDSSNRDNFYRGKEAAAEAISKLPAADVVEVVRCKDCEQYVAGALGYGKCNFFKTAIFSEFYCRYGGKKGRSE